MSMFQNVQHRFRTSSSDVLLFSFKLLTGTFVGLTLAIIGREVLQYGNMLYWFVIVLSAGVFLRVSKKWGPWGVVIFNLVCLLVGMILRMYILVSPGE